MSPLLHSQNSLAAIPSGESQPKNPLLAEPNIEGLIDTRLRYIFFEQLFCRRLDCYWVGPLDFKFLENQVAFSTKPPRSLQLFAGQKATKESGPEKLTSLGSQGAALIKAVINLAYFYSNSFCFWVPLEGRKPSRSF